MTSILKFLATATSLLSATASWSADFQVKRSLEVDASSSEVWRLIGDYCDIDDWHPDVASCALKVRDGSLVRVLKTTSGDEVVHKRIAREEGLSYTYQTVETSLPIGRFTGTLSVQPGEVLLIEWVANFSSEDPAMEEYVVAEIEAGLTAIHSLIGAR